MKYSISNIRHCRDSYFVASEIIDYTLFDLHFDHCTIHDLFCPGHRKSDRSIIAAMSHFLPDGFSLKSFSRPTDRGEYNSFLSRLYHSWDSGPYYSAPVFALSRFHKKRGARPGNQNAKKDARLKIQFRLDDPDLISRIILESKEKGLSESQYVRDLFVESFTSPF